ncbi:MAG: histidine--tRNA ligase [Candidatus Thermoplasmatota archaeon]|nr:histidine--tRNA ligase [Candidatus Thermoplasmatota archaeon]
MAEFTRPRGTRDFGPDEMRSRRSIESKMRGAIESFGYREISTPTFEHSDLFIARSGPQILDQIYNFLDKGGREIVLRPELTAPVMRFYFSELRNSPKPLRIYYFGNCFRYERPQKGRYREFWQMGLEYIGNRTPLALSEVINASISALDSSGLEGFKVRIGHAALLSSILERWGLKGKDKDLMIAIDKKDEKGIIDILGGGEEAENVSRLVSRTYPIADHKKALEAIMKEVPGIDERAIKELSEVLELVVPGGGEIYMDPAITRGLDYYDGTVFEIDAPSLGAEKQICGGGAYSLSEVFGGEVEGIGFGLGFDRVLVALGGNIPVTDPARVFYLVPMGEKASLIAPGIARTIREGGCRCILETSGRSIKKALPAALNSGAGYLLLMGDDEIARGIVAIKDLSTKEQVEVQVGELGHAIVPGGVLFDRIRNINENYING